MSSAPSPPLAERLSRRSSRGGVRLALALVAVAIVAVGIARGSILRAMGSVLVAEDPLGPADVIAVSHANVRASALEAAALYREGVARRIVVVEWREDALERRLDEIGVVVPAPHELAVTILERSGVPPEAISVLPGPVEGTNTELTVYIRFANREKPRTLLYVTSRSHTARAGWRLRREAPGTRFLVRAPRTDDFHVDTWWYRRGSTREVMTEYLRYFNAWILGDHWRPRRPSGAGEGPLAEQPSQAP